MAKGGKRAGAGRKKGSTSEKTKAKMVLGAAMLPDSLEGELWEEFLTHKDFRIKWEAFKLAKAYKSGQPARAKEDNEALKGMEITVRHIGPRDSATAEAK
jgi:hypothetical protein